MSRRVRLLCIMAFLSYHGLYLHSFPRSFLKADNAMVLLTWCKEIKKKNKSK